MADTDERKENFEEDETEIHRSIHQVFADTA